MHPFDAPYCRGIQTRKKDGQKQTRWVKLTDPGLPNHPEGRPRTRPFSITLNCGKQEMVLSRTEAEHLFTLMNMWAQRRGYSYSGLDFTIGNTVPHKMEDGS